MAFLVVAVVLAFALSLAAGPVWISPYALSGPDVLVLIQLRLPRALLGLLIGGGLGLSGAALQGYTRNPLADAGLLGVSSAASFGAVLALSLGLAATPAAVAGATAGLLLLAALGARAGMLGFVLAGAVLNAFWGAGVALIISLSPSPFLLGEILDWLLGALTDRSLGDVAIAAPLILAGSALLLATGPALDALTLGEDSARAMGFRLGRTRALVIAGAGSVVGGGVAIAGAIGFVGLIVPHLLRPWLGARPGALLLPSALGGATLLLVADSLVRLLPGGSELKLGVATALIGAPFFLWLLVRLQGRAA